MNLFVKSALLVDPNHALNGKRIDMMIEQGILTKIGIALPLPKNCEVFEAKDLHVSMGWFDFQVNFHDPGLEYKEDLLSGTAASAAGGFTGVACMSSPHSPIQSKSVIEYILRKTAGSVVDVYPIAALTEQLDGKEMTEMHDLKQAGAIAFSDGKKAIQDAGLVSRSLLYAKGLNAPMLLFAEDKQLAGGGKMNEGEMSTQLGIKGSPALAEEVMIARDLAIAAYHQTVLHFSSISTAGSVQLLREAKAKGIKVTCSVSVSNLLLTDESLKEFDSNYKLKPALRTQADVEALWKGLADGTIDVICSDHSPEELESKEVEFEHAAYGMIGLESFYGVLGLTKNKLSLEQLIEKIAIQPRRILQIPLPQISENQVANLTFFSPEVEWEFKTSSIKSKSKNSPFIGMNLKGKVLAIVNKNQFITN